MYCTNCGAEVEDGSRFCTNCGADLTGQNAAHGTATPPPRQPTRVAVPAPSQEGYAYDPASDGGRSHRKHGRVAAAVIGVAAACVVVAGLALVLVPQLAGPGATLGTESAANAPANVATNANAPAATAASSAATHVGFRGITSATASSTLATDKISTYYASNVLDGNPTTCWSEGVDGDGVGESITLSGSGTQTFSGFTITNGFQKTERIYQLNPRPTTLDVSVDGTKVMTATIEDAFGKQFTFDLPQPTDGTSITFTIAGVAPGIKYHDCSISDITVF